MKNRKQVTYKNWCNPKWFLGCLLVFFIVGTVNSSAQEDKKTSRKAERAHSEARKADKKGDFYQAEANYRKSISNDPEKMDSRYNLGTSYYDKEQYKESLLRFEEAGRLAKDKAQKQAAYHNLGNALMKDEQYRKAEEAFKEALRNDPTDEETRYNYAIAKELAKDEPEPPSEDQNPEEQEDQQDENQGGDDDNQDPEENEGDNEEDQGDEQEQDGDPEEEEDEGQKDQQEVPQDGKLSPEQIENLLNAMENAEKDLQKKLEEQKEKGKDVKKEKYW